jgi:hypothetical protein
MLLLPGTQLPEQSGRLRWFFLAVIWSSAIQALLATGAVLEPQLDEVPGNMFLR